MIKTEKTTRALLFLLRTFGYIASMLILISIISFGMIHLAPNSFFATGELNPNITPDAIAHLKAVYGLDRPLWMQYLYWMKAMVHLDFGLSFSSGKPVIDEIASHIGVTLAINLVSTAAIFLLSLRLGMAAALAAQRSKDRIIKRLALASFAIPSFYLALLLLWLLGLKLGWFPISGPTSAQTTKEWPQWLNTAWHLTLPIAVTIFGGLGGMVMYVRSLTLEILKSDYIFFAKARGIKTKALRRHFIIPNLLPSFVTMVGLSLPGLVGGSVIIESIFSINGMGLLFYQSALSRDYPVIMGILIITALLTLLGNLLADLILWRLNPYAKYQGS